MMKVNPEIRNRIRVAVAAYAYELENDPIMSDDEFDELARSIDPEVRTGNDLLDDFFWSDFSASTGQWIYKHPELEKIRWLYHRYYKTSGSISYDQKHNRDLFGPILMKPKPPEPVKHPCRVCGKDITKNPVYGGCHC